MRFCFPALRVDGWREGDVVLEEGGGGDVVAHLDLYWRTITVNDEGVEVAAVGQVCTDPDHRGQGLASRLLDMAEAAAADNGVKHAALFGGLTSWYGKRGYQPQGGIPFFLVKPLTDEPFPAGPVDTFGKW